MQEPVVRGGRESDISLFYFTFSLFRICLRVTHSPLKLESDLLLERVGSFCHSLFF